mgnify:FL=1
MATEIERKFLVVNDDWQTNVSESFRLVQGYLTQGGDRSVRVRTKAGGKAFLGIKSSANGITRKEYEYPIPYDEALEIIEYVAIKPVVDKVRHEVVVGDHTWEIDVFSGDNQGLVVAEIELTSEDEVFEKPGWLGEEVSTDPRYYNMNLVMHPFSVWKNS